VSACAWCNRRCVVGQVDEDGDPCCDACAGLAGLEYAGVASRRLGVSLLALRRAAKASGLLSPRQFARTWDRLAKHLSN
jgi:hypothetical protein